MLNDIYHPRLVSVFSLFIPLETWQLGYKFGKKLLYTHRLVLSKCTRHHAIRAGQEGPPFALSRE
jgi:hypothetical protein